MPDSSSASGSMSDGGSGAGYDGQGSPVSRWAELEQMEVEEKNNKLEVKLEVKQLELHLRNQELIAKSKELTTMERKLIGELQAKDEDAQALEAELKKKSSCIDIFLVCLLGAVVCLLLFMMHAKKDFVVQF